LAEPGQRLLARIADMLIVGLPVGLVRSEADATTVLWLAGLLFLYESVQLAFWGRTLGKLFAGIAVVRANGTDGAAESQRIGLVRSLLRTGVYTVPIALRPVPVLGVVASIFWAANAAALFEGTRRQALHDRLAGTLVTRAGR
jgi:uncharacterized RDD family membrane protein YckC